jgi:hypothetical protein
MLRRIKYPNPSGNSTPILRLSDTWSVAISTELLRFLVQLPNAFVYNVDLSNVQVVKFVVVICFSYNFLNRRRGLCLAYDRDQWRGRN